MKKCIPLLAAILLLVSPLSHAEELPLWELGIGLATAHLPDYRGADESRAYLIPFPFIVYRGDILKAEGTTVKGQIFESDRMKLDVSLSGSLPVNSDDNRARANMPDLDLAGEIGPSLELNLWKNAADSLWVKVPIRGVFSVGDGNITYRGLRLAPVVEYQWKFELLREWKMSFTFGPIFASERYHDYFYEVEPQYVRPDRPEYHPGGGYSGSGMSFGIQRRYQDFWVGAYARYDRLSGAAFEDSPLVKSRDYLGAGLMVTWFFSKSDTLVKQGL